MAIEKLHEQSDIISQAIKSQIKIEADRLIKEAQKELERRAPEIVAGLTVDIMQMVEMNVAQDRIVFTIRKK